MHIIYTILLTIGVLISILLFGILLQGKNYFLIRRKYGETGPWIEVLKRKLAVAWKCVKILSYALPPTGGAVLWWRLVVYGNGVHLHERFEGIATAGWIAGSAVIYGLFTADVLEAVNNRYHDKRMASKREDGQEDYINLIDEELSPVMYTLVAILSLFFLGGFLFIKYPDVTCGYVCISSISYILALIFFVIKEVDDHLNGTFVIKSIPKELQGIHAKQYRLKRNASAHKAFRERVEQMGPEVLLPDPPEHGHIIMGFSIFRKRP